MSREGAAIDAFQGRYGMRGRIVSIGGGGGVTSSARGATGGGPIGPG